MKTNFKLASVLSMAAAVLMVYGCSKSNQVKPASEAATVSTLPTTHDGLHVYGLLPTPESEYSRMPVYDEASFKAEHSINSLKASPLVLNLATPAVRDQGQIGACTGFAGSEAYEITYNYTHGAFPAIVSPAFLYYEERVNILGEKIATDEGANMVDIGEAIGKYGITSETLMPYPSGDKTKAYKTAPTAAALSYALGYEESKATLISTGVADTAAIKACLRSNIPVYFGFNVYDNTKTYAYFEGLTTTSYVYNPLTSSGAIVSGLTLLGGHANVIVGYDDTKKEFYVMNSWSTTWGKNGFYYLPYAVMQSTKIVPNGGIYYMAVK